MSTSPLMDAISVRRSSLYFFLISCASSLMMPMRRVLFARMSR